MSTCKLCDGPIVGRGFCKKHYYQLSRSGQLLKHQMKREVRTPQLRLLEKLKKLENGCWEFTGQRGNHGYGLLWLAGKVQRAHRVSYQVHKGKIPRGIVICHSCDNPPCCNPAHLFAGTRLHNNQDAARKKRHAFGERNGRSKINEETARAIKNAEGNQHEIAVRFGVSQPVVNKIKKGTRWKHLV